MKHNVTFNFKKAPISIIAALAGYASPAVALADEEFIAQFDKIGAEKNNKTGETEEFFKRKTFSASIDLPDFINEIQDETHREYVKELLANDFKQFVKDTYVDKFQAIGSHTFAEIKEAAESRGSSSVSFDYTPEQLKAASAAFGVFVAEISGNPVVGPRLTSTGEKTFSRQAIAKFVGNPTETTIKTLSARVTSWATVLVEQKPEDAEQYEQVIAHWLHNLDKLVNARVEDISNLI